MNINILTTLSSRKYLSILYQIRSFSKLQFSPLVQGDVALLFDLSPQHSAYEGDLVWNETDQIQKQQQVITIESETSFIQNICFKKWVSVQLWPEGQTHFVRDIHFPIFSLLKKSTFYHPVGGLYTFWIYLSLLTLFTSAWSESSVAWKTHNTHRLMTDA